MNKMRLEEIATTVLHEYIDSVDDGYVVEDLVEQLDLTKEEAEYFGIIEKLKELEIELEEE